MNFFRWRRQNFIWINFNSTRSVGKREVDTELGNVSEMVRNEHDVFRNFGSCTIFFRELVSVTPCSNSNINSSAFAYKNIHNLWMLFLYHSLVVVVVIVIMFHSESMLHVFLLFFFSLCRYVIILHLSFI